MIEVGPSAAFEAVFESGITGLLPGLEVAVIDNDGTVVLGPTALNVAEQTVDGSPTGVYVWNAPTAPATAGVYTVVWSRDGTFIPKSVSIEDLIVGHAATGILPPITIDGEGALFGPCSAWVTTEEIDECCTLPESSNPFELIATLEKAATSASQLLYELSGRQFSGLCERKVRPCRTGCTCEWQVLSRGHVIWWDQWQNSWYCDGNACGCRPLSRVKLSGYPVRSVVEVKIDGAVVDPATYRLDERRYLTRMNGLKWPSCQYMDLADTEVGTFSITYQYGQTPPQIAKDAAAQLACEVYKACPGTDGVGECLLPTGTTRVTRQGIEIERTFFQRDLATGVWRTGMTFVDAFLNSVNPRGLQRRPTIWAPGARYARTEGI